MRDHVIKQIYQATLYKKLLTWQDLNIQHDEWCHAKVVEIIKKINNY